MLLRNQFLNTASFLFGPNDPPNGGKGAQDDNNDAGGQDDNGAGGQDDNDAGGGDDGQDDTGAEGGAEAGDDAGDDGDTSDGDEDEDLAGLTPEAKAAAKRAIEKRIARETGWRDRQIDRLHAKRRSAEEDVRAAGDIVRRQPAGAASENLTTEQIEQRARELARTMTAQEKYDSDANNCDASGSKTYGDKWKSTMAKLPKLGGVDMTDMVDILNTDQPHVVLFSLADPETYERVMALPPARRRNEFVKLSLKEAPKPASKTKEAIRPADGAPPVIPLHNGRRVAAQQVNLADDKVSDDAWYAARNATRRKKFSDHA